MSKTGDEAVLVHLKGSGRCYCQTTYWKLAIEVSFRKQEHQNFIFVIVSVHIIYSYK